MTTLSQYFTNGKMVGITLHADSFKKMFWGSWSWGGREGEEAEIGSGTRVGGEGAGELHKEAPHESLFFP